MRNNGGLTIRNDGVTMENRPEKEETWSYIIWEKIIDVTKQWEYIGKNWDLKQT